MSDPVAVPVTRRGPAGMITLRGDFAEGALPDAVRTATGCEMPGVRRIVQAEDAACAWMSPDELMLFVPAAAVGDRLAGLARALQGAHHLAVDVTDARTLFRLAGQRSREVLAKGAPVDLAPAAFGPGDLRRTRLGQVPVAFWMPAPDMFELMCFRSVADFVEAWLVRAADPRGCVGLFEAPSP